MSAAEPIPDHVLQIGESGIPLEEAFADSYALFNETTRRYMEAYKQLEEQFEFLNVRLEETNRDLRDSLEEKDRVSNYLNNILESMTDGLLVVGLATTWRIMRKTCGASTSAPSPSASARRWCATATASCSAPSRPSTT